MKFKTAFALPILLLMSGWPLLAAPAAAPAVEPPVPRARLFDPATISLRTLPNGVRAIVEETRGTGVVAVQVWVRAGSRFESDANSGAAHLIETLALRASKNYPPSRQEGLAGGVEEALTALGGNVGAQTARDATFYSATVAATFLPAAVRGLGDAVLNPNLADADVESAKEDAENDLQRRANDPVAAASDLAYYTAFDKHPYRRAAGGTASSLEALTGAKVRTYYKARYVGANISVIVVGDVQRDAAHTLIRRYFADAPTAKAPANIAAETAPGIFRKASRKRPVNATAVALAFRAPGIATPTDVVAMDVLLAHWREGHDAALRRVLAGAAKPGDKTDESDEDEAPPQEPLALSYDVDFLTQRDPSLFIVSLLVTPGKQSDAVAATLKEIARVHDSGIEAKDLTRAKTMLRLQYIEQGETVSGQAGALGFYDMIDSYEFATTYLDRIARVTLDDIKRIATKYLSKTTYVQATIEPTPRPDNRPRDGGATITA